MTNFFLKDDIPVELELELRMVVGNKHEYEDLIRDGIVFLLPSKHFENLCYETSIGFAAKLVKIQYPTDVQHSNYRIVTRYNHRFRSFLKTDLYRLNHSPLRLTYTNIGLLRISNEIMYMVEL